jgi:hypothetical protein
MSKKKAWTWIIPLIGVVLVAWYFTSARHGKDAHAGLVQVDCRPFQLGDGWGYDIVAEGKTYIHQDRIPDVSGIRRFATKEDALKVAHLMVDKLKAGKFPPAVTYQEMKDLGVALD